MTLVDSHAHLDSDRFREDLELVLARAWEHDVGAILTIGCLGSTPDPASKILELLDAEPRLFAAFGVHPHDAAAWDSGLSKTLRRLLEHPRVVGLGEIGLDYFYENSPREVQQEAFRAQLEVARATHKPVIIHTRDAEEDTVEILSEHCGSPNAGGILHCFSGSEWLAAAGLKFGFHIAFGGILTFAKAEEIRRIAAGVPLESILIETDCPYLAPVPRRGKRNEPAYVRHVAEALSRVKSVDLEEIAIRTTANFRTLFGVELPG